MLGALFKKKSKKAQEAYDGPPLDPEWARSRHGKYHRLEFLDTVAEGLKGFSGVYVIWHSGSKPGWVYVGRSDNLAADLDAALENEDIHEYEINGGLYVTWSPVLRERQDGVVKFLNKVMKPKVKNPAAKGIKDGPVNVLLPTRREE